MKVRSTAPLTVAPIAGRIKFPDHSLTVVVKGLFRLDQGQITQILEDEELAFPTGDLPVREDEGGEGEIRYASDFVHYKPRTDLMLVGCCHPPDAEAVRSCRVTFGVGEHGRSLQVFGDRWWAAETVGHRMTDPEPFTKMELSWERAYGGPHCPDNPVGRGNERIELEDGRSAWPLPNVEHSKRWVSSPDDRPIPAGFGPLAATWEPRRSHAGTYDDEWLRSRWPWFPEDLDWNLFNAAPAVLQAKGFLKGDEELYLENLRPGQAHFRTRLPGLRVRCFANELPADVDPPPLTERERQDWTLPPREELEFREIPLNLDTLWVDAEEGLVALVWRGHGPVRDEEFGEVQDLFVITEPLDEDPADLDACRTAFWALVDEEEGVEEEETASPADVLFDESVGEEEGEDAHEDDEEEDLVFEPPFDAMEKLRADLEAMGIDPDNPPEPSEEELEQAKEFFRERGMDDIVALLEGVEEDEVPDPPADPSPPSPWTRERVAEQYAEDGELAGADLEGLDLSEMELDGANLSEADLTGTDLSGATLAAADLTGVRLEGARLQGADLTGAVLESAVLREADLTKARAADCVLVQADLSDAILVEADFTGAEFTGATLDRVNARKATFESAEFDRVRAVDSMFAGANMRELRAADALDLTAANLTQVDASGSVWSGATLERAVLAWAVLDGADFTGANLRGSNFYAAHLREACFAKANLLDARLAAADAFEASFEKAELARADLRGGNFYGAEFRDARFWETDTRGTNLTMTKYG